MVVRPEEGALSVVLTGESLVRVNIEAPVPGCAPTSEHNRVLEDRE